MPGVSHFRSVVVAPKLLCAIGFSSLLHVAAVGIVYWSGHSTVVPPAIAAASHSLPLVGTDLVTVEPPPVLVQSPAATPIAVAEPARARMPYPRRLRADPTALTDATVETTEAPKAVMPQLPLAAATTAQDLRQAMLDATERKDAPTAAAGFGSMEMLRKERKLERALTWVFPKIISQEKAYWQWPLGELGKIRFVVDLSDAGRITGTRLGAPDSSARLGELVQRMTRFLSLGRFELGEGHRTGETTERHFELAVSHVRHATEAQGVSGDIERLGFVPPESGRPGRGYVVDATGHEFTALVREVAPQAKALAASQVP